MRAAWGLTWFWSVCEDVSGGRARGQGALVLKLKGRGQHRHQQEQSRAFNGGDTRLEEEGGAAQEHVVIRL